MRPYTVLFVHILANLVYITQSPAMLRTMIGSKNRYCRRYAATATLFCVCMVLQHTHAAAYVAPADPYIQPSHATNAYHSNHRPSSNAVLDMQTRYPSATSRMPAMLQPGTTLPSRAVVAPAPPPPPPLAPVLQTQPIPAPPPPPVIVAPVIEPGLPVLERASEFHLPAPPSAPPGGWPDLTQQPLPELPAQVPVLPESKAIATQMQVIEKAPDTMSAESRTLLKQIPKTIIPAEKPQKGKTNLRRYDPEIEGILSMPVDGTVPEDATSDSDGVSIRVRRPLLNAEYELQKAWDSLNNGETWIAIEIYKDILKEYPGNQDALFGIATGFHRSGEIDWARPFYEKLLRVNPRHQGGLNNLLALVAEESPQEALKELHRLESNNKNFAPIQAQLGLLYHKTGEADKARYHLLRAVRMEPANVDYKYNLAIVFDEQGDAEDAVVMYRKLLQAARNGEKLPTGRDEIEQRVIYLTNQPATG